MTAKVMFSLPEQLASRMRATIPLRERSKVATALFEKEVHKREQSLYRCAKELEDSKALKDEMAVWDAEFSEDGLEDV